MSPQTMVHSVPSRRERQTRALEERLSCIIETEDYRVRTIRFDARRGCVECSKVFTVVVGRAKKTNLRDEEYWTDVGLKIFRSISIYPQNNNLWRIVVEDQRVFAEESIRESFKMSLPRVGMKALVRFFRKLLDSPYYILRQDSWKKQALEMVERDWRNVVLLLNPHFKIQDIAVNEGRLETYDFIIKKHPKIKAKWEHLSDLSDLGII